VQQDIRAVDTILPFCEFTRRVTGAAHRRDKDHACGAQIRERLHVVTGTGRQRDMSESQTRRSFGMPSPFSWSVGPIAPIDPDQKTNSPSSERSRDRTRDLATRTVPGRIASSSPTSSGVLPSTTTFQNACHVWG
jgi:hypothetical protein